MYGPEGFPERAMALSLIDTLGIDPETLAIWEIQSPMGEIFGDFGDMGRPGWTVADVHKIVEEYNSLPNVPIQVAVSKVSIDMPGEYVVATVEIDTPLDYKEYSSNKWVGMDSLLTRILNRFKL